MEGQQGLTQRAIDALGRLNEFLGFMINVSSRFLRVGVSSFFFRDELFRRHLCRDEEQTALLLVLRSD